MTEQEEIAMLKKQIEELQDAIKGLREVIDSRPLMLLDDICGLNAV